MDDFRVHQACGYVAFRDGQVYVSGQSGVKMESRLTSVLHFAGASSIAFEHVRALLMGARREPCRQRRRTT